MAIPDKATHLVRGYDMKGVLITELWVQGWGTVETETEVFKSMPRCLRVEVVWLANAIYASGPQHPYGHVETVWRR